MVAPAVPELTEEILHESIDSRTEVLATLRELGPPDLVQLIKQIPRNPLKQVGVYHHVTGVDASSSASLAAYINTLTYKETNQSTQKIAEGVYCCYNAFSRLDMRVHVTIPGSVDSYCVDERGEKRTTSDELWLETYLCSVLRAYSYADDGSGDTIRKIIGVRRFNPITTTENEHKFLQAAEQLFFRGWQLGSSSVVQVPNNVSNHLTSGLLKYFQTTGRFTSGINLFEKLRTKNVEVSSLLAKVYLMGNEEVKAVRVLHNSVKQSPMDYVMLDTQAEFLVKKALNPKAQQFKQERLQIALGCADRSTVAAPSEFGTWARLAEVYVAMEDWENALTTLNSCPMFTYQDKDAPLMPEPKDIYLPMLSETRLEEIDSEAEPKYSEQVHPSLLSLRAVQYKGTFKHAYSILTEMTAKIGWDQLLKIRSNVFVMEEEYRSEKNPPGHQTGPTQRNTSTDVIRGSPNLRENGDQIITKTDHVEPLSPKSTTSAEKVSQQPDVDESVERPTHTITPEEVQNENETVVEQTEEQLSRFNNKRLCERWLDSLFMVLYEDLRIYTIWRTEMAQYRAQQMHYKKSAEEWEILGSLAERLQHKSEAIEAYRACLSIRFSPKALKGILSDFEVEKNPRDTVASVIRLITWQYRWYSEFSPELLYIIRTLIEDEGALKIRSIIQATSLSQNVLDLTHHYAALCAAFRSSGTDG
ncbi:BgTH12-03921 [Blumeria graminis f. sp. triticale]|uniref:BgTH12-03921 n=1 Tax=Blumeria graminis f. sp. triticale TaxID=1689686 RepID=A0A9W4DDH1_BLUGR|nr:BgTH12-03921 [Blumeria graminis f. sp. triticale]